MSPRIAIVGFGMAGIGSLHALRNLDRYLEKAFEPSITVFEAAERPGGKAAPLNLGAQFLDADALHPMDRIIDDLGLETHAARNDYELVTLTLKSQLTIEAETFARALSILRREMSVMLVEMTFAELDRIGMLQFLDHLNQTDRMTADEEAAMRQRMLLEEGTTNVSALHYALCLAKSTTPSRRLEVVGGLHRIAVQEKKAATADNVRFHMNARVDQIEVKADKVRIWFRHDGEMDLEEFDGAILAVSPEHLRPGNLRVKGSTIPLKPIRNLKPARITKSNVRLRNPVRAGEHATERYAMWYSSGPPSDSGESTATFFHGWEGQTPLSMWQMLKAALGHSSAARLVRFESQTWDGVAQQGEIPMAYISQPSPGQCLPLLCLSRDQYFRGVYDGSPLRLASHALGFGGTVREAALTGEWAVISLLRGWGHDVSPAMKRIDDPERELFGASAELLARALG